MNMWQPKYLELKERALKMKREYNRKVYAEKKSSIDAVNELSEQYNMPIKSIYRYLKSAETKYPQRKRADNGRYL